MPQPSKKGLKSAVCLLLACVSLLAVFSVHVVAASEPVEEVLDRLAILQKNDISPEWQPDIAANEAMVSALLDAYLACSSSERDEFTSRQNAELRAYFEALYTLQGRGLSGVDDIFEGRVAASSQSASSRSSSSQSSSSQSASSQSSSSQSHSTASSSSSQSSSQSNTSDESGSTAYAPVSLSPSSEASESPASSLSTSGESTSFSEASSTLASLEPDSEAGISNSIPHAAFPPQVPKTNSLFSFMGSASVGRALLFGLILLCFAVFLRFLWAVRRAGRAPGLPTNASTEETSAKPAGTTLLQSANLSDENADGYDETEFPLSPAERRAQRREERLAQREEKRRLKEAQQHFDAPPSLDEPFNSEDEPWTAPVKDASAEEIASIARLFGEGGAEPGEPLSPPKDPSDNPYYEPEAPDKPALAELAPAEEEEDPSSSLPGMPDIRPVQKGARTGRPGRIRFSQGDAHDIDAIDD